MNPANRRAFTLVELAIVLVIVGLLAGGVLVGQDLMRAASIRSVVGDIEKYNAATTTFRNKYSGLPGDLSVRRAIEFNLSGASDTNATGAAGLRDGNGVIEGGAAGSNRLVGEIGLFWQDLGKSTLIGGNYTGTGTTTTTGVNVPQGMIYQYLPKTRLRENVFHFLYAVGGTHYYYLATFSTDASANVVPSNALTPLEARAMDEKMDDAFPTTGTVLSMRDLATADTGAAASPTVCATNASPPLYNVSRGTNGAVENQVCQLRTRSSF